MRRIAANRDQVLDVQTQYTDGLEDSVKSVFVRGIADAIAARDAWHHDKVTHLFTALQCDLQQSAGADAYHTALDLPGIISLMYQVML